MGNLHDSAADVGRFWRRGGGIVEVWDKRWLISKSNVPYGLEGE
jgi:hypothetical protein